MEAAQVSVATGAMKPVLGKLDSMLSDEYKHFEEVRGEIRSLIHELTIINASLHKMSEEEDPERQDKVWMNEVRELSYNMNDSIDGFMKHVTKPDNFMEKIKHYLQKLGNMKAHRRIRNEIKNLEKQVIGLREKNERYRIREDFSNIRCAALDRRALAIFKHSSQLTGIDEPKAKIIKMLTGEDGIASTQPQQRKIVSIVGFGGIGKTTLANQVYQDLKGKFECWAFLSLSRNPNMMSVLRTIFSEVSAKSYADTEAESIQDLLSNISNFLVDKRYLIVIDDIWNENLWEIFKYAFCNNNLGSRIITTTRTVSVSKEWCSSANDSIYQMEPLSDEDSEELFYPRIFGSVTRCPNELQQVSSDFLKTCGGVPVAIITVASVLANLMVTKDVWHALFKSIGHGFMEGAGMDSMRWILSLSYYDLPPHLKTCSLYLSIFPVTHPIERKRLVKKLIAEGIVTQETKLIGSLNKKEVKLSQELSPEEAASQYLDELANKNVIQSLECKKNGEVITYHIHPMMHDALKFIAIEDKFAASIGKDNSSPGRTNFLHLSIDCTDSENLIHLPSMAFGGGVRSLTIFGHASQSLLKHFKDTRVLDLEGCKSIVRADVEYICSMVLLKQLCLAKTQITMLPPQIGNLKYLERLDVGGTRITELPPQIGGLQHLKTLDARKSRVKKIPDQVVRLTRLVHLLIGNNESCKGVNLPDGIGNMTSLQQLCTIDLRKCSASSLKDLGALPDLKEIEVVSSDRREYTRMNDNLLSSLDKSTKLSSLVVHSDFRLSTLQSPSAHKYLNCRKGLTVARSLKVPIGIARQQFLGMLDIRVCTLDEDDLKILRELPRLQSLTVRLDVLPTEMIRISCEGFAELESFYVDCQMPRVIFEEGAMPKLENFGLQLYAGSASKEHHMHINHLLSLQVFVLQYSKWYATNKGVREMTDTVKTEVKKHQNKITLCVVEEDIDGTCGIKTEETDGTEEEEEETDGTGYFLKADDTKEGDLHQNSCAIASCSGTNEIEEVGE